MSEYRPYILDRGLNAAVLHITSRLFPTGFDVGAVAPDTFEALREHVARTGRMLVWSGASDQTIFGDPEVNYAFRAWHDWAHLKGNCEFTPAGEARAVAVQQAQLRAIYGDNETTRRWCRILDAEVNGQVRYHDDHGDFPADQVAFVQQYLAGEYVSPSRDGLPLAA